MDRVNNRIVRCIAVSTVAAFTLGVTACTAVAADEPSSSGLAVALGEDSSQDVVDLYTDRDTH